MSTGTESVIEKIDKLLEDDKNFTTRVGLRFMTTVMKEALQVIADIAQSKGSTNRRLELLETALNQFLTAQEKKEVHADSERTKWRWAIITPTLGFALIELIKWFIK